MEVICEILTMIYNDIQNDDEFLGKVQILEEYCERITGFRGTMEQLEHFGPTTALIGYNQSEKIAGNYTGEYSYTSSLKFSREGISVIEHSGNLEEAQARCAQVLAELMG